MEYASNIDDCFGLRLLRTACLRQAPDIVVGFGRYLSFNRAIAVNFEGWCFRM